MSARKSKPAPARKRRKSRRKPASSLATIQDLINNARAAASVASDALDEEHEEAAVVLFEHVVIPLGVVRDQLERLARGSR